MRSILQSNHIHRQRPVFANDFGSLSVVGSLFSDRGVKEKEAFKPIQENVSVVQGGFADVGAAARRRRRGWILHTVGGEEEEASTRMPQHFVAIHARAAGGGVNEGGEG